MHEVDISRNLHLYRWYTYLIRSFLQLLQYFVVYIKLKTDSKKLKIHAFMLYEFKLGNAIANTIKRIFSVYRKGFISERIARKWFKRFKEGNESLEDKPSSERSSVIEDGELREYMRSNPRQRVCK